MPSAKPNGEPIRLANWRQRVWDPAVAAAGLTGLTPHDLRHTAASLAIASGASVKHVQRMLGHKDAAMTLKAMTLNVYASLFENDLDDVSNRFDAALLEEGWPVCGLNPRRKSSNCPSGSAEEVLIRPNVSAPPAGFEPATRGLGKPSALSPELWGLTWETPPGRLTLVPLAAMPC